ncbi:50S ribosomal protein L4 [Rhodoligotrophos defluvii]|uniref:50S ribosomal protein L4 n=1 Tax=Rhodoligotrophos defluvii TaxID=2561934 RepID=UPI0010C9CFE8|nr:50S ribosomal protein L4 [Rhodoligotrophos defluvii]
MKLDVKTLEAKDAGSIELPGHIFGLEPRADILHRMVVWQLAKRRAGTHQAKNRAEVAYSTAKLYKQKGTGRARHGSRKAGLFRGGGKAFGPVSRDHAIDLPKKVRALALKHALSAKAKAEELVVLDQAVAAEPKTKALKEAFGKLGLENALIIGGPQIDVNFGLAARNVPGIDVLPVQGINVYDILRCKKLVLTRAAIEALEERFK